jgi:hypothetical protein
MMPRLPRAMNFAFEIKFYRWFAIRDVKGTLTGMNLASRDEDLKDLEPKLMQTYRVNRGWLHSRQMKTPLAVEN